MKENIKKQFTKGVASYQNAQAAVEGERVGISEIVKGQQAMNRYRYLMNSKTNNLSKRIGSLK